MIDTETRQKLLNEIRKFGNVYLSCLKIGVDKATYYRWKQKNKNFKDKADEAENMGRENICDVAEHALLQNIKDKNQRSIEFVLNHNSERYKQKQTSNVVILHKTEPKDMPGKHELCIEDILMRETEEYEKDLVRFKEQYKDVEIPLKADGSPIAEDELLHYEAYIEEWYKKKKIDEAKMPNNTTDSKPQTNKPPAIPQENKKV
ncbi:MAG: hypothetical protein COU29_02810 [Candidatus Magasanikbacteria bacterium CG10_big_fil_rev_8_21_14_0_10_36_32]|uniref:Homeodomain phBC6A51-type domain-containing protein n=1 Tax=Candidatus Magasanikbacteria bacterium CG10_big_fil_rev_8_21_14_0_10_36_32 TaxID=1974646 RepID=A0A2M6W7C2_9BACT|nr:MAG: hypothetical protein COU29_02810 [Candidatus Magasanikbacteria bacterium CG10_big_fil_rev_8_21_14_0_10_36_32]